MVSFRSCARHPSPHHDAWALGQRPSDGARRGSAGGRRRGADGNGSHPSSASVFFVTAAPNQQPMGGVLRLLPPHAGWAEDEWDGAD